MGRSEVPTYFKASMLVLEVNVPIHKPVSIITDGVPATTNENVSLIGLCKNIFSYHCVVHQQPLCSKVINFEREMSVVEKTVNSI